MNWQTCAADDLRNYIARKESIGNIRSLLRALAHEESALKSSLTDSPRVHGGNVRTDDRWLSIVVERARLIDNLHSVRRRVEATERGLAVLDDEELRVLESFYIAPRKGHVEKLMDELKYEKSHIYRLKDRALGKYTRAVYGAVKD